MPDRELGDCRIGVAGLGDMGLPMARNMRAAGFDVIGHDVRPAGDFASFGDAYIADPSAFAAASDILFSVVRDAAQTDALLFGDQAVLLGENKPAILVVCSTLSPRYIHALKDRLPAGIELVDAPMSGAPYSAEQAILTFMIGGRSEIVAFLDPLFRTMGRTVHHLGETGAGMTAKVLNNFVCAAAVVAVRRVGLLAPEMGLDPAKLREVMSASSGGSWFGNNFDRIKFAREGYDPANTMGIIRKDVAAYLDAVSGGDEDLLQDFEKAVAIGMETLPPEPGDDG